jgi:hypothetical protein
MDGENYDPATHSCTYPCCALCNDNIATHIGTQMDPDYTLGYKIIVCMRCITKFVREGTYDFEPILSE